MCSKFHCYNINYCNLLAETTITDIEYWERAVAMLSRKIQPSSDRIETLDLDLSTVVNQLLYTRQTFCYFVYTSLLNAYLRCKFVSYKECVLHARGCFNAIAGAVLEAIPFDVWARPDNKNDIRKRVVNMVDERCLMYVNRTDTNNSTSCNRKIRDRVWTAIRRLNHEDEQRLSAVLAARDAVVPLVSSSVVGSPGAELASSAGVSPGLSSSPHIECLCMHLAAATTAWHKLLYLVELFALLSNTPAEEADAAGRPLPADELIQRVIDLVVATTATKQRSNLSTRSVSMISPSSVSMCWWRECSYMQLLCKDDEEASWLLGAEGYALATLQQALCALVAELPDSDG